jgi:hypothetical protein
MPEKKRGWYCETCCPVCSPAKEKLAKRANPSQDGVSLLSVDGVSLLSVAVEPT